MNNWIGHDGEFINVSLVTWARRQENGDVTYFQVGENVGDSMDIPSRATGQLAAKLLAALTEAARRDPKG